MSDVNVLTGWRAVWLRILQAICGLNGHPERHKTTVDWTLGPLVLDRVSAVQCKRCWKWLA